MLGNASVQLALKWKHLTLIMVRSALLVIKFIPFLCLDRKTVSKGCSNQFEDNQCKQSYLGPKIVLRCTCDSNFCNGDRNLAAAGLQSMPDGSESKFSIIPSQITLIVIFSFLFVLNFIFHFWYFCLLKLTKLYLIITEQ